MTATMTLTAQLSASDREAIFSRADDCTGAIAAFGPDADAQPDDPDVEATDAIAALLVEPRWGRRGHGSRLLSAIVELARLDGVRRLVAWVPVAT